MNLKLAEQWADDVPLRADPANVPKDCSVEDRMKEAKALRITFIRQIQADALRAAASVAYDGCQGDKIIHDLLIHEANQLDPRPEVGV